VATNGVFRKSFLAILFLLLLVAAGIFAVGPLRWRAIILFDRATGRLNDLNWSDVHWALGRGTGVDLERLAATRNPYESIESPRRSAADLEAGTLLFRQQCSPCHGEAGIGGPGGPSLQDRVFRNGRSDWALFRTITLGLPGTAMAGRTLPRDDTWRLVTYLKQILAGATAAAGTSASVAPPVSIRTVTPADLLESEAHPAEWLTYSGSYAAHRHSSLTQIDRGNIAQLRVEWQRQLTTPAEKVETTPLVRGSTMFATQPPNQVLALDAATGKVLWTYTHDLPAQLQLCCGPVNRGVALLGDRVFVGTLDAHLISLDASTGKVVWDVAVADASKGYSITAAPLAIDNMILTGVAGGEFGVRGFIDAYDAGSGARRWRTYTVPEPGQPGAETWADDSLRSGGGPTWLTGAFDPESRTIYWGVGNPSPNFYGQNRSGDNLYTNSVVAIDVDSGKLRWYFQFTPHDLHDWDSVQVPVLVDAVVDGEKQKLLAWANRNGFYYLLNRTTGKFLLANAYVKQTWTDGLDSNGRPHVRPESVPSIQGAEVYPGIAGGTNWWSPSYDPDLGLLFVPTVDKGAIFYASAQEPLDETGENLGGMSMPVPNEDAIVAVKAIEVTTGRIRWQHGGPPRKVMMESSGVMSTAGKLVFGGDGERLVALDSESGTELWHFAAGAQIWAAPITYELEGRQYVAVAAGRSIIAFSLPGADSRKNSQK
jgi:alcohol dehydrogenase (cytochrome c)